MEISFEPALQKPRTQEEPSHLIVLYGSGRLQPLPLHFGVLSAKFNASRKNTTIIKNTMRVKVMQQKQKGRRCRNFFLADPSMSPSPGLWYSICSIFILFCSTTRTNQRVLERVLEWIKKHCSARRSAHTLTMNFKMN